MNDYYYPESKPADNTMVIAVVVCVLLCIISSIVSAVWWSSSGSSKSSSSSSSSPGSSVSSVSAASIAQTQTAAAAATAANQQSTANYIANAITQEKNWAGKVTSTNSRCGPNYNETSCPRMECCNMYGICGGFKGNNDYYCATSHGWDGLYDGKEN
jgi:hypothetical protein